MKRWTIINILLMLVVGFILLLLLSFAGYAQTPVALSPVARQQFFDAGGKPLAGGALFTFIAGTTTQQATYSESTGTVPNSNPIILDAGGFVQPGPIFLSGGSGYKFVLCAAFTGVAGTGTCALYGPQQWSIDNILLSPFLSGNNTFTGNNSFNGTTTFNGPVNMNGGGSLSGTFSGSPTFSGTPIFSGGMTVTGGTFTSPVINAGTGTFQGNVLSSYPNSGTGTGTGLLAKLTGAPSTVITIGTTDASGITGICVSGCSTSGSALISTVGQTACVFDGATVAGDYVIASTTTAGNCHDLGGGGYPSSGQVLGRVLSTNGATGTYQVDLFPADIRSPSAVVTFPQVVYNTASASTNANTLATTMVTVGGSSATYRFNWYITTTVLGAACTASTQLVMNLIYQDPIAAGANTVPSNNDAITGAGNFNGILGQNFSFNGGTLLIGPTFRAKTGTAIQYSVTYNIGANCAPGPQYQVFPILEQITSN